MPQRRKRQRRRTRNRSRSQTRPSAAERAAQEQADLEARLNAVEGASDLVGGGIGSELGGGAAGAVGGAGEALAALAPETESTINQLFKSLHKAGRQAAVANTVRSKLQANRQLKTAIRELGGLFGETAPTAVKFQGKLKTLASLAKRAAAAGGTPDQVGKVIVGGLVQSGAVPETSGVLKQFASKLETAVGELGGGLAKQAKVGGFRKFLGGKVARLGGAAGGALLTTSILVDLFSKPRPEETPLTPQRFREILDQASEFSADTPFVDLVRSLPENEQAAIFGDPQVLAAIAQRAQEAARASLPQGTIALTSGAPGGGSNAQAAISQFLQQVNSQ